MTTKSIPVNATTQRNAEDILQRSFREAMAGSGRRIVGLTLAYSESPARPFERVVAQQSAGDTDLTTFVFDVQFA